MHFEYDPKKNEANQAKRHVSFEEAIGKTFSVLYSVIHTRRGDAIRVISARRATKGERRTYECHKGY